MSLSSKSTIVFGIAFILILTAVAVLVIRVLRLQQKVLALEKLSVTERQKAWLLSKQKAAIPPQKSTRDVVLDVLMEIEQLKQGSTVQNVNDCQVQDGKDCPVQDDLEDEDDENEMHEDKDKEDDEDVCRGNPLEDLAAEIINDPRNKPFSIFSSIFGKPERGAAKAQRAEIVEIIEE
jgi:hypothetical protein